VLRLHLLNPLLVEFPVIFWFRCGYIAPEGNMLDMLKSAVSAYADIVTRGLEILGVRSPDLEAGDKLTDTLIAAIATAVLAGTAYVLREAFSVFLAKIEEKRKFKSAQVRYIFDTEIWMRDFATKFSPDDADKLLALLCCGPDDFRFGLATSKDEDSSELMLYIHWLEPEEIYTVRRSLTYADLFDSMCELISSENFSRFETDRKLTGLVKMIETGMDAYRYAEISLVILRGRRGPIWWKYLSKLCKFLLKLVVYEGRTHLSPPSEAPRKPHPDGKPGKKHFCTFLNHIVYEVRTLLLLPLKVCNDDAIVIDPDRYRWTTDEFSAFEARAKETLKKALDERRKRLRHEQLLRLLPY
jgi:hypothetical protein